MEAQIDPAPRVVQLPHGWIAYLDDRQLASFATTRDAAAEHVVSSAKILDALIARAKASARG
jgi:hypothetical protein